MAHNIRRAGRILVFESETEKNIFRIAVAQIGYLPLITTEYRLALEFGDGQTARYLFDLVNEKLAVG
jgi:hypothetical protein